MQHSPGARKVQRTTGPNDSHVMVEGPDGQLIDTPQWMAEVLDRVWASGEYVEPDPAPPAGLFRPAVEDFLDGVAQGLGWHDDDEEGAE